MKCPKCGSVSINQYRMMTGKIWCNDCGFEALNKETYNPFVEKLKKPSKYKNKKVEYKELTFDYEIELEYYLYLLNVYSKDVFPEVEIKLQPVYTLLEKFTKKGKKYRGITYKADFEISRNGKVFRVIDVKGMILPIFSIKEKLFNDKYPDIILEVITKSPKWCEEYALDGWIETDLLKKLRVKRKKGLI